jgi:hypothetical protein
MRHATTESLDRLDELLARFRALPGLREPRRGVFYHRSKAFLHFHEDPVGLFADVRFAENWERFSVDAIAERDALFLLIEDRLASAGVNSPEGAVAGSSRR